MNLSTMRTRVMRDLTEANVGNMRIVPSDLNAVLNDGYEDILSQTMCCAREKSIATVIGTSEYTIPADMISIRNVRYYPETMPLEPTTFAKLNVISPAWRDAGNGTPTNVYMFDSRRIGIWPPPVGTGPLYVEGAVIPSALGETDCVALLSADSDVPAFPANYHMALVHYAVWTLCAGLLLPDNQSAQVKAAVAKEKYERIVNEMKGLYAVGVSLNPIEAVAKQIQ